MIKRSPIAADLRNAKYRQRIVRNKRKTANKLACRKGKW